MIYVIRGIGRAYESTVYLSADFKATILYDFNDGDWRPASRPNRTDMCYPFFYRATGISLEPGCYTTIKVTEQ